jgi:biotin carboxyl carrier protein
LTFDIELAGRTRRVLVEALAGARFRVTLDGHPHLVDAVRAGDLALSLIVDGDTGTSCEAYVVPGQAPGERLVRVDGYSGVVTIDGRRGRPARGFERGGTAGGGSVVAPMPGRVVRILVGVGDEVSAREPVLVMEAMKMENELRSPKAGRIADIHVVEGASVEAGRLLIVVE